MQMLRQGHLPDEARFGFVVVIAYCISDLLTTELLPMSAILEWIQHSAPSKKDLPSKNWRHVFQIGFLGALTALIWYGRSWRRSPVEALADIDPIFFAALEKLSIKVAGERIRIHVTENMTSINAYCPPSFYRPTVVIDGGLRLLFRKKPAEALAIMAHEFAHIRNRDASLMLLSLCVIQAYALLLGSTLISWQLNPEVWQKFMEYRYARRDIINYFVALYRQNIIPTLLGLLVVFIMYLMIVRSREHYADAIAGEHGYRSALKNVLRQEHCHPWWVRWYHPDRSSRLAWLLHPHLWADVNPVYIATITFLVTLIKQGIFLARPESDGAGGTEKETSIDAMIDAALREPWAFSSTLGVILAAAFLISHHIYRVILSRLALAYPLRTLLAPVALAAASCALGVFIAELGNRTSLSYIIHTDYLKYLDWEHTFGVAATLTFFVTLMSSAAVLVSLFSYKRPPSRFRIIGWALAMFAGVLILWIPFNALFSLVLLSIIDGADPLSDANSPKYLMTHFIFSAGLVIVALILRFVPHHARARGRFSRLHQARLIGSQARRPSS